MGDFVCVTDCLFKFNNLMDIFLVLIYNISSQFGKKCTLFRYNQDIIDLFNLVVSHVYSL